MKKLVALLVLLPSFASAESLGWDAAPGAEGYELTWGEVGQPAQPVVDVGNVTSYDLDALGLTVGTRYEFSLRSYAYTPRSYSSPSDSLRWTQEPAPVVIETLGRPVQIMINP